MLDFKKPIKEKINIENGEITEVIPEINEYRQRQPIDVMEDYISSKYDMRLNTVRNTVECKLRTEDDILYKEVNPNTIRRELLKAGIKASKDNMSIILGSDYPKEFNPFREYLKNLTEWKQGDKDHIEQFAKYVTAKDQVRFNNHFKKMFIRIVRSIIESDKGYYNKHCFVLVHDKQNSGKTTFCKFLTPTALKNYRTDNFTFDKDGIITLYENLIIELDELATLSKADLNGLKSMFSKTDSPIRRPYGERVVRGQRVASFVGSTNSLEFLNDETGSVRWLCFEVENIDWKYSTEIDINLCYAQALYLYNNKLHNLGTLTHEEIKENEIVNKQYLVLHAEHHLIDSAFEACDETDVDAVFKNSTEILTDLSLKIKELNLKVSSVAIGKAMKMLGFIQVTKKIGGKPYKVWALKIK